MDIQAEKKWIKAELDKINDETLIHAFKNLLDFARKKTYKVSYDPMSLEEFYQRVEESRVDIKRGRVKDHEEVKEIIKTWKP